jgi:hypothetical protein
MALDLAILGADGTPTQWVSVRAGAHHQLISAAKSQRAQLTLRMEDFYADTDYAFDELPPLLAEFDALLTGLEEDEELAEVLRDARGIVDRALQAGCGIAVIAD